MSYNFKFFRNYILTIEDSDGALIDIKFPYTCEFRCTKNVYLAENNSNFKIYNLNKQDRQSIYKDMYDAVNIRNIEFRVDYLNITDNYDDTATNYNIYSEENLDSVKKSMPLIFKGNVRCCKSYRQGVNMITEIDAYDWDVAQQNSNSSFNADAGTSFLDVFKNIFSNLKNDGNVNSLMVSPTYSSQTLQRGRVFHGNSLEILNTLSGNNLFFEDNSLQMLGLNEAFKDYESYYYPIDADTGLLESPQRQDTSVVLTTLLEPQLKLGQIVSLTSTVNDFLNGDRKIMGIEHQGTISFSVSGQATTKIWLFLGAEAIKIVQPAKIFY